MADLTKLHDEALHTIKVARDAYDQLMTAQRVAKDGNTENTRHWIGVALGRVADTINAAQATLYGATVAMRSPESDWRPAAVAWLRAQANEQEARNKESPRHAAAYPSWGERVRWWRSAADDLERAISASGVAVAPALDCCGQGKQDEQCKGCAYFGKPDASPAARGAPAADGQTLSRQPPIGGTR